MVVLKVTWIPTVEFQVVEVLELSSQQNPTKITFSLTEGDVERKDIEE